MKISGKEGCRMKQRMISVLLTLAVVFSLMVPAAQAAITAPKTTTIEAQKIWNYFYAKIGNEYGVAGLMGNLKAESALKSINLQNSYEKKLGYNDTTYTDAVDNGTYTEFVTDAAGYGLAQWTYHSRKSALLKFAQSRNASIGNLEMQMDYLWKELSQTYTGTLSILKSAGSVKEASDAFLTRFEKPAVINDSVKAARASNGQTYYDKYATGKTTTPTAPNVKFTLPTDSTYTAKQKVTNTNAVVVNKITKPSGTTVSQMGVILYDANGKQLKKYTEKVSNVGASTTTYHSWYDINSEVKYTLTPGTTYKYKFWGTFNGVDVISSTAYSFKTTGTAPTYYLDLNGYLDGADKGNLSGYATADVYINGSLVANDCTDYYTKWPAGTTYQIKDIKAASGYTYNGVRSGSLSGTIGTSGASVRLSFSTAQAEPQEVTIYYYTDGNLTMTQTTAIGDIYASDYMVKDGYTFLGWYSSPTGGTKYNGTKITETSPRTLYAQYTAEAAQQYTLSFYSNGSLLQTKTVTNGASYGTLPTPSLSGYTFQGWYTSPTGGTKITSTTTVNLTGNQALYARFAAAETPGSGNIILQINNPTMYINGRPSSIDVQGTVPVIRNDRTLLPVRAVFEAMGGTVGWDGQNRIVTLMRDGETLYLQIGTGYALDGALNKYYLDSAPVIINDRTMLPIRFIVEYFDGTVEWDGSTRTVLIRY